MTCPICRPVASVLRGARRARGVVACVLHGAVLVCVQLTVVPKLVVSKAIRRRNSLNEPREENPVRFCSSARRFLQQSLDLVVHQECVLVGVV